MRRLPLDYAIRNLGRSPTRLLLTVGGSGLLVLIVLTAAAFVRGMGLSLQGSGGANNVILLGTGSEESVERSEIGARVAGIVAGTIRGIREDMGTPFVSPEVHVQLPTRLARDGERGALVMVRGVTPAALLVHDQVRLVEGRLPMQGRNEVMVGGATSTRLGVRSDELAVGGELWIDKQPWIIVGRFEALGTVMDAEIWTSLTDLKTAMKRETDSCVILTLDPQAGEYSDVDLFARTRLDLELTAIPETAYYARLSAFFAPIRAVVWITAGLIAIGGLLGGLNTMYAAFVSRVREFGTLQALGFRRVAILASLVQESVVATAAGALIGSALGLWLLDGVAVRFSIGAFGLVVDAPVLGVSLGAGLILGVIGAMPPGIRCLRMPIPSALKAV
ncbi:MAG: ABC transporter permease [Phycisphaeraceae bacterium]|nr:MAG: ABC transporter permease [Phycisphaeraceae bacterium]